MKKHYCRFPNMVVIENLSSVRRPIPIYLECWSGYIQTNQKVMRLQRHTQTSRSSSPPKMCWAWNPRTHWGTTTLRVFPRQKVSDLFATFIIRWSLSRPVCTLADRALSRPKPKTRRRSNTFQMDDPSLKSSTSSGCT